MRNVYIVVAHDEKTEKKYVKIIKNKLEELGLAQFYSLHFTSAIIKKTFYSIGSEFFDTFFRNVATEFGEECHYHILVFSENEQYFDLLGDEAEKIINAVVRSFGSWNERFNIRLFFLNQCDKDPLFTRFKHYRPVCYDIKSDDTESKKTSLLRNALKLYVGSAENIIPLKVNDDLKIKEKKSIVYEGNDRIPDNTVLFEKQYQPSKDIFSQDTILGGEMMKTIIIILSANSANTYMLNIKNYLQELLNRRSLDGKFYDVRSWNTPGTMLTGRSTLPNLMEMGRKIQANGGFALCIFTPDDPCTIKGNKVFVSRDNVWLEYGLFSGLLGLDRVFVLCPHPDREIQITSEYGSEELEARHWHYPSDFNLQGYRYTYTGEYENDKYEINTHISNIADEIIEKSGSPSVTGNDLRTKELTDSRGQNPYFGFKSKL